MGHPALFCSLSVLGRDSVFTNTEIQVNLITHADSAAPVVFLYLPLLVSSSGSGGVCASTTLIL